VAGGFFMIGANQVWIWRAFDRRRSVHMDGGLVGQGGGEVCRVCCVWWFFWGGGGGWGDGTGNGVGVGCG
jgi:hypothetical protein